MRRPPVLETALAVGSVGLLALSSAEGQDGWELSRPAPVAVEGSRAKLDRLEELSCGECHAAIVEEWAETQHALAWVDEVYQEEMQDHRRPETCHGCHVPVPVHGEALGGRPDAREEGAEDRHFGISCNSCHLASDGAMLGPRGISAEAHASRASETMTGLGSNQLCITCHATNVGPVVGLAKDFMESDQAASGRTCVGCHMAEVRREDGTTTRSHALQTPRDPTFARRAFEVSASGQGGATVVTIANLAGHRVPGLLGRDFVFDAELLDGAGAVAARGSLKLNTRTFLPVGESVQLELKGAGPRVRLVGRHYDPRLEDYVPFLEELLAVPGR